MTNVENTIQHLNQWKEAFLNGSDYSWEKSLGMTEISDELSGISEGNIKCLATHLFSKLSEKEKEEVARKIDFYLDFEALRATYDL